MPIDPLPQPAEPLDAPSRPDAGGPSPALGLPTGGPPPRRDADGTVPARRCGRCLAMFPGDPGLDPIALAEWWLCPTCRLALLGHGPLGRPSPTGARRGR